MLIIPVLVYFLSRECNGNPDSGGVLRIVNVATKREFATWKVSNVLDTFLYLQDSVLATHKELVNGIPDSAQCFGFEWQCRCDAMSAEQEICRINIRSIVQDYQAFYNV